MKKFVFVTREIPPCKGCALRHMACHQDCEKYKDWKLEVEKIKSVRRDYESELKYKMFHD